MSRGIAGRGQHVDVSIQEVAFSRNVNGVLVWQFDRRKLHRVGGALNYGKATVRCIWPLADGWCFHSLMTGRFGAPANQALSDWIDDARPAQSAAGRRLAALQPLDARSGDARRSGSRRSRRSSARARRAEIRTEGRRRGINACVVDEPGDVLRRSASAGTRTSGSVEGGMRRPSRFALLREATAPSTGRQRSARGEAHRAARRRARARLRLGARRLDHDEDPGRPGRGRDQGREPHASLPVAPRRAGVGIARRRFRRQAVVRAPEHVEAQPRARPEEAGSRARCSIRCSTGPTWSSRISRPARWTSSGWATRSWLRAIPGLVMASGSVYGQTGPLAQEWGVDGTGARAVRAHLPHRLARSRSGDSGRRALWRRHRSLCDGGLRRGGARASPRAPAGAATSMRRCTRSACSRCMRRSWPRSAARRRSARGNADPACCTRMSIPRAARIAGWRSRLFDAATSGRARASSPAAAARRLDARRSEEHALRRCDCSRPASPPVSCRTSRISSSATQALRARGALRHAAASEARAVRPRAHADRLLAAIASSRSARRRSASTIVRSLSELAGLSRAALSRNSMHAGVFK